jgi:hypothetical protein
MSNIRLHPKYGVNPTMPICIICSEPTGEIAMLGASYKEEAPKYMVIGIEPCEACRKKHLKKGILLVEVERGYVGNSNKEKETITGKLVVLKDEAFKRIFNQELPKSKIAKVEVGLLDKLSGKK